jgi:puromycin-sensitive aminopeptidase
MTDANPYRLPRSVLPERYELVITPKLTAATFHGRADIRVRITEPVTEIRLNAAELEITSAVLATTAGDIAVTVSMDEQAEVATLALAKSAAPGPATLSLEFAGTLNDKLRGFYRSTFTDADGVEQIIATTQFEATDARRAFPCWDEPDFKAVFATTLIVDRDLVALSNAALSSDTDLGDGTRKVVFADTMIMSTYLVAFIVGPFVVSDPVDVDGVPLRVACVPGAQALTPFALESGAAALRFLSGYFGIDYPGGKLDLIAIPDFAFGAMENLGCVTFRETALLVDPARASRAEVERVADVVGHEIAHMWFGDLVTMTWWHGIWLNEAFATFMQMSFTDNFRPSWDRWISFGIAKSAAMTIDSLSSTRPIEFEVVNPDEAQGMFDLLTYQKGAAVLRMLEQHLGPDRFAAGISAYLANHSYGNAETRDLWNALESTSGEAVAAIMDTWILQGGHPVVRAELSEDGTELRLSQKRFHYLPDSDDAGPLWQIPIGLRVHGVGANAHSQPVKQKLVLAQHAASISVPSDSGVIIANDGSDGFYRVSYSPELLGRITANLAALQPLERFALATDTWALCLSGATELADALRVMRSLTADTYPDVWSALLAPLRLLDKMVDDAVRPRFQAFVADLVTEKYEALGWDAQPNEGERPATLRGIVIAALGGLASDSQVRGIAADRYQAYLTDKISLDNNLVQPVESVLAATNSPAHYETLFAKFAAGASTPQEKVNALHALARFSDHALVERTLGMILDSTVRTQDAPYAIALMVSQRGSGIEVWRWCEQNWDDLMRRFPKNSIARMIEGVSAQLDPAFAATVIQFLEDHPVPQARKAIAQICERLQVNANFYQRNVGQLGQIFQ